MEQMLLGQMLQDLRAETRVSTDGAHGAHLDVRNITLLRRIQKELYAAWDWPFLMINAVIPVIAGARYVSLVGTNLDLGGLRKVYVRPGGVAQKWSQLTQGIGTEQLMAVDSDAGETRDCPLRYDRYMAPENELATDDHIELWPVPTGAVTLRVNGLRSLNPLVDPALHSSTLDGTLLVLFAAAEILAAQKADDAPVKLQRAQARLDMLKRRQSASDNSKVIKGFGRT